MLLGLPVVLGFDVIPFLSSDVRLSTLVGEV
jgi:hypothetical protein